MSAPEKRVVFAHPYFTALPDAVTHTLGQLVGRLIADGRPVTVLCLRGERGGPDGVPLWEVPTFGLPVQARWTRPILQAWFLLAALLIAARRSRQISWMVTVDTPSGIGFAGLVGKACTGGRARHACWVLDLFADQVEELNYQGPYQWLHGLRRFLFEFPYRFCDVVVTIGDCMRDRLLTKGVRRVVMIPQWQDADEVRPAAADGAKEHFGLAGRLIALYAGNADIRHPLLGALAAAARLSDAADIHFLFVGRSDALLELERLAIERGLDNVSRWDPVPWGELGLLLSAGDVHLVSLARKATGTCVPSKAYSAMAVSRPVIFLGDPRSQVAIDVERARAGSVVDPDDGDGLARALVEFRDDPVLRGRAGESGHRFFTESRELKSVAAAWGELLSLERKRDQARDPSGLT